MSDLDRMADEMLRALDERYGAVFQALRTRLDDAERKIATLEAQKGIAYKGVWRQGEHYDRGQYVTCAGSLWHANESTDSRPGDCMHWTLVVKAGKDGRDAR